MSVVIIRRAQRLSEVSQHVNSPATQAPPAETKSSGYISATQGPNRKHTLLYSSPSQWVLLQELWRQNTLPKCLKVMRECVSVKAFWRIVCVLFLFCRSDCTHMNSRAAVYSIGVSHLASV